MTVAAALRRPSLPMLVATGIALGVVYTLSPLTVLCLAGFAWVVRWASQDLSGHERRWFYTVVIIAVALRLMTIAGLFLSANHFLEPYATFFGDEQLFKNKTMWLRNVGFGIPISKADYIYAFDETGTSSYLYILAYAQALLGPAPYGMHVANVVFYCAGVLILFRMVRPAFGKMTAMAGLVTLLFMPTLFIWSISALKEPLYTFIAALELYCALHIVRSPTWLRRAGFLVAVLALALILDGLRKGGLVVAVVGTGIGVAAGLIVVRPRLALASLVLVPALAAVVVMQPRVQDRLLFAAREGVRYHAGHVVTPGYSYAIIDPVYYGDWGLMARMPPREAGVFVVRALESFVVEPRPWTIESRMLLAYLPEHMVWLVLAVLLPFGVVAGLRRDALVTSLLAAHAAGITIVVALTSGNIGTLIRHRGLAVPYITWLSMLGACALIMWALRAPRAVSEGMERNVDR